MIHTLARVVVTLGAAVLVGALWIATLLPSACSRCGRQVGDCCCGWPRGAR
jgi:hypothetical protein